MLTRRPPAMGRRTSNPSLTTRATLSPEEEAALAEQETDTCRIEWLPEDLQTGRIEASQPST